MSEEKTLVIFRTDREGVCFALFPEDPGNIDPTTCSCYQHNGQHGSADFHGCISTSRPSTEQEKAPLKQELENIGYCIREVKKASYKQHKRRWDILKAYK